MACDGTELQTCDRQKSERAQGTATGALAPLPGEGGISLLDGNLTGELLGLMVQVLVLCQSGGGNRLQGVSGCKFPCRMPACLQQAASGAV